MNINNTPPPPQPTPVPAQIQTVNAAQTQRLTSPIESIENDVNSGKYGKGFTLQKTQNVMNFMKDAGSITQGIQDERNRSNSNKERNSALKGPGYADHPPNHSSVHKSIEKMRANSASAAQETTQPRENKGIAMARQKASAGQSGESQTNSPTNKGISSYQNRANGQSSPALKDNSSGATYDGQSR